MTDRTPAPRSPVFDVFRTGIIHGIFHSFPGRDGDWVEGDHYRKVVDDLRARVAKLESKLRADGKDRGA